MLASHRAVLARNPEFRRLFLATVVSLIGDWSLTGLAAGYGLAWLAWMRPLWRR